MTIAMLETKRNSYSFTQLRTITTQVLIRCHSAYQQSIVWNTTVHRPPLHVAIISKNNFAILMDNGSVGKTNFSNEKSSIYVPFIIHSHYIACYGQMAFASK